jgi:Tol biopolymer transport system component
MSPEQASGKPVDRRADNWSFGVVLFEMLSGRSLFTGETPSEILAAVIKEEPPWTLLPRDSPPAVLRLLRRCLRKRPRERLQDIGDARLEIADVLQGVSEGPGAAMPGLDASREIGRRRLRERWAWAAAAVLGAIALLIGLRHYTEVPEARSAVRLALDTPEGLSLDTPSLTLNVNIPAASPDGRSVVYVGTPGPGGAALWIASLASGETRPLPGTEGALMPFWSPDGASVALFAPDGLRKIRIADGSAERICTIPADLAGGGSWNDGGTILFSVGPSGWIRSVPAGGGEAKPLVGPDESRKEKGYWWPQFLPDGRHFIFSISSNEPESAGLYVASLDSPNDKKRILPVSARAVYAAPGYLLFLRDKQLLAQRFDARHLEVKGDATPIAHSVASAIEPGWGWFTSSANGRLAYMSEGTSESDTELVWLDRKGQRLGAVGQPARYGQIALSPDGKRVAVEIPDSRGPNDLWVVDVERGVASRVTADPAGEWDPVWSPDGRELVFGSDRNGTKDLFRKSLQVNEPESLVLRSSAHKYPESWSPDGKTLLYVSAAEGHPQSVWGVSPAASGEPELLLENGFAIDEPHVSPEGHWLAYTSVDSGEWEVYIQAFHKPGERVRVSVGGGGQPKWRGDGRELFYLARDGRVMAVAIKSGGPSVEVGLPAALFAIGSFRPDFDDYAPAADGQRFLVKVPVRKEPRRVHVVLDWPSLLRPVP